jgi:hypothetical protein
VSKYLIAVYRMHQPTYVSPCILGTPCRVCALHASCRRGGKQCNSCRSGEENECERAHIARPAFLLNFAAAVKLVKEGRATFVHRNCALRLNFEDVTPLRGQSCRVDPYLMWQYTLGSHPALIAVDVGWGMPSGALLFKAPRPQIKTSLPAEAAKLAPSELSAV